MIIDKIKRLSHVLMSLKKKDSYRNMKSCDILFCCSDEDLGDSVNLKFYSKTIDYLLEKFQEHNFNSQKILFPFSSLPENKIYIKSYFANRSYFMARLLDIFLRTKNRFSIKVYKNILEYSQCKYIIGIGLNEYICKAADELGIFTVEVLHALGYPDVKHPWFTKKEHFLPKGLIVFDDISYNTYSRNLPNKTKFLRLKPFWLNEKFSSPLVLQNTTIVEKAQKYKKTILVSLQWGYDKDTDYFAGILENGVIHKNLVLAIQKTQNDILWLLRLHPVQLRGKKYKHHINLVQSLCEDYVNTEYYYASHLPLHTILPLIDGHITMSSMLSYEASYFNIKTFFMCPTLREGAVHEKYFVDLVVRGLGIKDEAETKKILEWINTCNKNNMLDSQEATMDFELKDIVNWLKSNEENPYEKNHQICTCCVMDTTDPKIVFDANGVCNHCREFDAVTSKRWLPNEEGKKKLEALYAKIKQENAHKNYDCILGLSGGVDSSYLALKLYEAGIRPLVVHVDGGWNSALAVANIEKIIRYCGWDLHTIVIDWEEMKDLQLAYLKSGIANQDVPQDHAFFASLYHFATKHGINYIISGGNIATESIFPKSWHWDAMDAENLRAIHKQFGTKKLKNYKTIGFYKLYFYYPFMQKMRTVRPLNFMSYIKSEALQELKEKIGYKEYTRKHEESIFTKFFQNYWLPAKWGYDKRKPHLSSLILSSQMTREEALEELSKPLYNEKELEEDKEYIAKKLGISTDELERIFHMPPHSYKDFANMEHKYTRMKKIQSFLTKLLGKNLSRYS